MSLDPYFVRTFINEALPPSPLRDAVHVSIACAYARNSALYSNWSYPYHMTHHFLLKVLPKTFGLSHAASIALTDTLLEDHYPL